MVLSTKIFDVGVVTSRGVLIYSQRLAFRTSMARLVHHATRPINALMGSIYRSSLRVAHSLLYSA